MKTNLLLILLLFFSLTTNAQGYYSSNDFHYDLESEFGREYYSEMVPNQDSSFVLLDRTIVSYTLTKSYIFDRTYIEHKVYYIGNADDIDKINRLYLYKGSEYSDTDVTVRTIKPNGDVVEQDKSKLEEVDTDNGNSRFVILAISGIEVNGFVEVVVEKSRQSAHNRVSIDNPFPTLEAEIYIHASKLLHSNAKDRKIRFQTYGKFEQKTLQAVEDEENDYAYTKQLLQEDLVESVEEPVFVAKNIIPYSEESYSHEYGDYTRVDLVDSDYSWSEAAGGIGSNIFPYNARKNIEGRAWLSKLGIRDAEPMVALAEIERFLKEDLTETESSGEAFSMTKRIWKKRIANEEGILRMADQLLDAAEFEYLVYLCSNKEYIQIDPEFPFTRGLNDILFYFPKYDMYMMPTNGYYRTGEIPDYLASNRALVVLKIGAINSDDVVRLPTAKKEYNMDGTRSTISIDEVEEKCTVDKTKMFYGNRAIGSRGYYHFSDEDERKEYIEELLVDDLEMELSDVSVMNEALDLNFQSKDTLFYSGTLTGSQIVSSIPNGFILNPGAVMGTQISFYDTDDRKSDIYIPESKVYEHTIIVEIPAGYSVEGTNKLAFDKKFFANKRWLYGENQEDAESIDATEPMAQFVSEVVVTDTQVRIEIYEYYVEGFYPKQGIEDLQEVVNAAYEFYIAKIKLVKE